MQWCVTELGIGGRCCCGSLDDGLSQMIFFASIIKSEAKTDGHAFPFSVPLRVSRVAWEHHLSQCPSTSSVD